MVELHNRGSTIFCKGAEMMKKDALIAELTMRPVIAAVRGQAEAEKAAKSPVAAVFLLGGSILTLKDTVQALRDAGKAVFVHMDLCEGLGRDAAAVCWCARNLRPDGMISTKSQLLHAAREEGLMTIQRMFLMDSASLVSGMKLLKGNPPDMVELMPGLVTKAISAVSGKLSIPVIAGGMITEADEVAGALKAGALAVSTSDPVLWRMGV